MTEETRPLIYIIEDHKDVAFMFRTAFTDAGFQVINLDDGQKAVEQLETQVPDVILLDLNLPTKSGEEVIDMMRADNRYGKVHTILSSSNYLRSDVIGNKFDHVLEKPFVYTKLRELAILLHQETAST